jgi:hypothetical protein
MVTVSSAYQRLPVTVSDMTEVFAILAEKWLSFLCKRKLGCCVFTGESRAVVPAKAPNPMLLGYRRQMEFPPARLSQKSKTANEWFF